ncbi:MAG: phosphate transport system protein [Hyphomicrobiaceae bacterium]|jgi:phosphate transport system protein
MCPDDSGETRERLKPLMSKHFELEMERLKRQILRLAGVVEDSVGKAVVSIETRDSELAQQVIDADDDVDAQEVEVEEECLKILALHQPVAFDLRFLVAVLKLNNDLERIGDLAVNIAERASAVVERTDLSSPIEIGPMAEQVRSMLADSLDALVNVDVSLARRVLDADDVADDMHRMNFRRVEDAIRARPEEVSAYTHYLSVSRYLERIADHATNIAEDVIYLGSGAIVRHKSTS